MLRHLHLHRWTLIPHAIPIHVSLLLLFLTRLRVSILHVRCWCVIRCLEYWILLLEHVAMAVSVWIPCELRFSSLSPFHLLILSWKVLIVTFELSKDLHVLLLTNLTTIILTIYSRL